MKLTSLQIKNYRNFENSGSIPYHDLTVFVGENGSGKTTAIDALTLLLEYATPKPTLDDVMDRSKPVEIEAVFNVPETGDDRAIDKYLMNGTLTLRYSYDIGSNTVTYSVKTSKYTDDRLNTYEDLSAPDLKEFVRQIGRRPGSNKVQNYVLIEQYIRESDPPKGEGYIDIQWTSISAYVPVIQRFSSADYNRPESIVSKTLTTVYRTHFYEADGDTGEEKLKQDLVELRDNITTDLNDNINNQLKDRLSMHLDGVRSVGGEYDIDFARGFTLRGVSIDFSGGHRKTIDQLGEGHRKKATLAILEWDAEVSASLDGRSIIKAYDEPDANLDFTAQRKMFNVISKDAAENANVSVIVCTHSLALIDRAPAESINRVVIGAGQVSTVEYLKSNGDEDIKHYLSQVAEVSGLRNSSIFYEKAFLVVEGESEEASMAMLYKKYTGVSMPEDGIVLINIKTNGQWNNVLKFLSANKSDCTVLLLDNDTQQPTSSCQVTTQKLIDSGFSSSFLSQNCFFIGTKEFEDTYSDADLATMANNRFPRDNGIDWVASDFAALRGMDKFSAEMKNIIRREYRRGAVSKPIIAYEMAVFYDKAKISQNAALKALFDRLCTIVSE